MMKFSEKFARAILIRWSSFLTALLIVLAVIGAYLGLGIQLRLSLTDLLPKNHPSVVKFEKLTEVVGGVGYFIIVLHADDQKSHLQAAPEIVQQLKQSSLVRDAFYHREQRFFVDRMLYYVDLPKLRSLEQSIREQVKKFKRSLFDLGLWENEKKGGGLQIDETLKEAAKKSAGISPYLISKDSKYLLVMVKPSFDSMELAENKALLKVAEETLQKVLPPTVSYDFSGRYYNKIIDTEVIEKDIIMLGTASVLLIALILLLYIRSIRTLLVVFLPVLMGIGITTGLARIFIGQITIVTGFLMGILSGLGVDYGIHLALRLQLEKKEPSSADPDPVWRTLSSSGHAVFVGAIAASFSFFLLCFSSFKAFSEFGFICGTGIAAVFVCLLVSFSCFVKLFKLNAAAKRPATSMGPLRLPNLESGRAFLFGNILTAILVILASQVRFEYDFAKMLQHSKKVRFYNTLVDQIYERSTSPSAFAASSYEQATAVEKLIKDKYMPSVVDQMISGASIIPADQKEKQVLLTKINELIAPIKDRWLEKAIDIPTDAIRKWVIAKPFVFENLPAHIKDALRGTGQKDYLLYIYPAVQLDNALGVKTYAEMFRKIEAQFPDLVTGSDAVIFADILDLITQDGFLILAAIFLSVGFFIWLNTRNLKDTLNSYLPLLFALLAGMGLMAAFDVKFNIFNIAIIPTFVAMGIDVPIHIVHRMKEINSGYKAADDLAPSINLSLLTAGVGFGVLIFARAGVLQSLGWIALLGTAAIWWVGLIVLPAYLDRFFKSNRMVRHAVLGKKTAVAEHIEPALD